MLQSEFIKQYCRQSKITEKELLELGLFAVPCNCEEDDCDGWCMLNKEGLDDHVKLGHHR